MKYMKTLNLFRDGKELTNNIYYPLCESGNISKVEFDSRFVIDRNYGIRTLFKIKTIRFVKHPDVPDGFLRTFSVERLKAPTSYLISLK